MAKSKLPKTGEEIESMRIALALVGVAVDSHTACLLIEVFKSVQKLGGKFSVGDAVRIQYDVRKRYEKIVVTATKNNPQDQPQ